MLRNHVRYVSWNTHVLKMHDTRDEIFCDLMELPPSERGSALEAMGELTDADKAVIHQMLAEAQVADAYFNGISIAAAILPHFHVEKEGDMCGPYKLVRQIGEGGFGLVWLAVQERPLKRTVAVKVIKAGMDSIEVLARFDAEKQALARMDHPNIAKVLDAGMTDLGRPYFVMELVAGENITCYCHKNGIGLKERLRLFSDVCSALNHAHQKGVIHRDIKPSNVIVTEVDSRPVAKVIDFGIAKAIEGHLTDHSLRTRLEQWIGTPAYMSPEQAGLGSTDVDTRSDIYALGVLLYELITGVAPFDSDTLMKAGYEEMRRMIREVEPPRPSVRISSIHREAATTRSGHQAPAHPAMKCISSELDWIVMKAIEKAKERRYESVAELASDVTRYLSDKPVEARPPSTWYLMSKFVRRHRRAMVISVLLFVVLITSAIFSLWQAAQARQSRDLATARLVEAVRERNAKDAALQDAEAVSGLFTDVIRRPSPEIDGRTVTMVEALEGTLRKLNEDYVGNPKRHAMLLHVLAETYENLGIMDKSIEIRHKALDVLKSLGETSMQESLETAEAIVSRLGHVGKYREAAQLAAEVFQQLEVNHGRNNPASMRMLAALAQNTFRAGDYPKAIDLQESLVRQMAESMPKDHPHVADAHATLLAFCCDSGDTQRENQLSQEFRLLPRTVRRSSVQQVDVVALKNELEKRREILIRYENDLGKTNTKTIAARMQVASSLAELGYHKEAVDTQVEVVNLCKVTYGETHPRTLEAIEQCLGVCNQFSEWDVAMKMRQEAAMIRKETLGLNHYESLCFHGHRLFALSLINRADEGLQLGEEFLPQIRQVMGPNSRAYYHYSCNYARCLAVAGRSKDAIAVLAKSSPHMSDDTFVNLLYGTLLVWSGQEQEYERLRTRMLDFWRLHRDRETQYTYQLERNALICTLLPFRNDDQREEIVATLAKVETIFESPQYKKYAFHGPSWSKTIQGIIHYRLGNNEMALQRFKEARRISEASGSDTLKLEHNLDAIYRPLALHGLGRAQEAKQMFVERAAKIQLWKDDHEPLCGGNGTDGVEIAVFLSYKEAAQRFAVPLPGKSDK